MKHFRIPLTSLLVLSTLVLSTILWMVGSALLNQMTNKNVQSLIRDASDNLHEQVARVVDSYFDNAEMILSLETRIFSEGDNLADIDKAVSTLRGQIEPLTFADYLYFTSKNGQIVSVAKAGNYAYSTADAPTEFRLYADSDAVAPTAIRKDLDFRKKSWYVNAVKSDAVVWTDPYPGEQVDTLAISASKQVVGSDGEFRGVLGMDILLPELNNKIRSIDVVDGSVLFISAASQLISSNQESPEAANIDNVRHWEQQLGSNNTALGKDRLGQDYYIHRSVLKTSNRNWHLVTAIPHASIKAPFESISNQLGIVYLLLVISIVFGILIVMRFVNKWLEMFILSMSTIANNNWSGRFPSQIIKEANEVAVNFNALLDRLSESLGSLAAKQSELNQLNSNLESIVKEKTKKLNELAIRDPLTGAYNRRFIDDLLTNTPMTGSVLALIDIDFFKAVNDNFGHNIGDEVLQEIVLFFKKRLRKGDVFGRYGGEEFIVILENVALSDAKKALDRYRVEFDAARFSSEKLSLTFSCGIAQIGQDKRSVLIEVDKALYRAKSAGRNNVAVYEPE